MKLVLSKDIPFPPRDWKSIHHQLQWNSFHHHTETHTWAHYVSHTCTHIKFSFNFGGKSSWLRQMHGTRMSNWLTHILDTLFENLFQPSHVPDGPWCLPSRLVISSAHFISSNKSMIWKKKSYFTMTSDRSPHPNKKSGYHVCQLISYNSLHGHSLELTNAYHSPAARACMCGEPSQLQLRPLRYDVS